MINFFMRVVFSVWFFKHKNIFIIWAIIHVVGTAILLRINIDCIFLASMLNSIFILLEMLSQYLATVIIRGVFRTMSNMMRFLSKYEADFSSIIPFWQGSELTSDHDSITFSNETSLKICFFLRIMIKRKIWVRTSHLANSFKKSRKCYIKYCCTVHSRTRSFQVG